MARAVKASANDTIAALATPPGAGARGVVRVSGPRAGELVRATWVGTAPDLSRRALLCGRFDDGRAQQPLLCLWMPAPHSFTREDVAEFHLCGHPELLRGALEALLRLGARAAEPGEFTRRAFHSGRIDLTRAEGVLALVFAANETEARVAHTLLSGGLERRVQEVRAALVDARTLVEAALDFDEHDTGHVPRVELEELCARAAQAIELARGLEIARADGGGLPRIVLCGAPNAGKSSLFNALGGDALVSSHAGTTRDLLELPLSLAGSPVVLVDTAGLDAPESAPDRSAQRRAEEARAGADLLVWVLDASATDAERAAEERARLPARPCVVVWHKSDLASAIPPDWVATLGGTEVVAVSSLHHRGLSALLDALRRALPQAGSGAARAAAVRHARALDAAADELALGRAGLGASAPLELVAEHWRRASAALDAISGETTPEDVLDRIFARFCLGK